ncbi:hypothetical protein B0H10DRAFT_2049980 [Mycena sp. CBHHK59/15]|nr:hypothetical protein B0H10DRAFT_2124217 [Mycena sp. CBHHK59/15]KAJ6613111.1 hypothetical protein B0H10DRAFT_2049980 [Mycena sp. CBHHK59/15]
MAIVILASDFLDRGRGPGAIKVSLVSRNIPDADKIDVYPPTPKVQVPTIWGKLGMPWTNIATECSPGFLAATLRDPVYHHFHNGFPITFYCLRVQPESPWVFAVYFDITTLTTAVEFKDAAFAKLLADPGVVQMVDNDHSNIPGEHDTKFVLDVAKRFAEVSTCTVRRRGQFGSIPLTAYRLLFPPISKDPAATEQLQKHIMSSGFAFDIPKRGEAKPWFGPNSQYPEPMSCSQCHGIDHYNEDCPIILSDGYQTLHGMTETTSSVPTSLSIVPDAPATNDWATVPYRGRGHARGGRRGYFCGGRSFRGNGRGYMPYH